MNRTLARAVAFVLLMLSLPTAAVGTRTSSAKRRQRAIRRRKRIT